MVYFLEYFWKAHEDVKELMADVDPRNSAAIKLLTKHGFVKTGYEKHTFKLEDEWCDSVYLMLYRT
jgi:ribosomal-protein-alanine N-acetyltransferase